MTIKRKPIYRIKRGDRLLGQTFDGKPIVAPKHCHSLTLAAAGSGKTTCGAAVWIACLAAATDHAMVINDCKEGELAAQYANALHKLGLNVAVIDDFNVLNDHPLTISLNPLSEVNDAYKRNNGDYVFSIDTVCQTFIPTPSDGDMKNEFFRSQPKAIIELIHFSLVTRHPALATPGGIWSVATQPDTLKQLVDLECEEGDESLKALARNVKGMIESDEHYPQHLSEVRKALRIYSADSPLHRAGTDSQFSHRQLLRNKTILFMVGPVRHMERLGGYYALHIQSFLDAQIGSEHLPCNFVLDEMSNAPYKSLVSRLTTMRGYGGHCHMIAQSRSEIERKYGEKETRTIAENAVIQQFLGFSSEREAEMVSKMMGDRVTVSGSLNTQSDSLGFSSGYQLGKERLYTTEKLLSLPSDEQIIFIKDVGWIHCKKVAQNQIAPLCDLVEDNPLEGAKLPPDPRFTLDFSEVTT